MNTTENFITHYNSFESDLMKLLKELVEINSFSHNCEGVQKVQAILRAELESLGMICTQHEMDERGDILVAATPNAVAEDASYLLLSGHSDTVHRPESDFTALDTSGKVWKGPGVYDMKGGLIVALGALKILKAMGNLESLPIRFLINSAEELTTEQTRTFMSNFPKNATTALVLESGRPEGSVVTDRFGLVSYIVEVHGKRAHAGNEFTKGISAIYELARVIARIEQISDINRSIFCNVGTITGGVSNGVIADYAKATFEVRLPEKETLDEVRDYVDAIRSMPSNGASVTITERNAVSPLVATDASIEVFQTYSRNAKEFGIEASRFHKVGGLSDANWFSEKSNVAIIDALGPSGSGAHTHDEQVIPESFRPKTCALAKTIVELCR